MTGKQNEQTESDLARSFVVRVTLMNGAPYAFNLHDVTWIDWEDLHGEIAGQAQRYAFYATLHVGVKDELRTARRALETYVLGESASVREYLGSKATETHVKQVIAARDEYGKIQAKIDGLESLESRVGVVREALVHRRDMLQSAVMLRAPERGAPAGERSPAHYRPGR